MVELKPVDAENFWDVISLTVADNQREFVVDNAVSIAQAYVQKECVPLAVYDGETPVGFLMYCIDRDDGEYWIYRLMTDQSRQGRGYGRAALTALIERIRQDEAHEKIFLGVHREAAAVHLYESLGFAFNGQVFGSEHIMVLQTKQG